MNTWCKATITAYIVYLAASVSPASAAPYVVQSCTEGVRETAPTTDWSREPGGGSFDISVDCSAGAVTIRPTPNVNTPYGGGSGVRFTASEPLTITGMKVRHYVALAPAWDGGPWHWSYINAATFPDGATTGLGRCYSPCSFYAFEPNRKFDRPARSLTWYLLCEYEPRTDCRGGAEVRMHAEFVVDDPSPPRILTPPSGAIFAGGTNLAGEHTTSYEAADLGSGVYRAEVDVDGAVVGSITALGSEHPQCVQPFRVVQPCPGQVTNGLSVDTRELADGPHTATLRVYDATEQNVASYGPIGFSTSNRRVSNFCSGEKISALSTNVPRKALKFGRPWTFRATLSKADGMEVVLLDGRDAVKILAASYVPAGGRLAFPIPAGSNRLLRLAVRPSGSVARYACSNTSKLRVKAKVQLRADPEEVSNGRAIRLTGRLLGKANRNRPVVVQARAAGSRRWATVRVVRTRDSGRFSMRYRFLSTFRTVTYIFRAQARSANGYPYATGTSRLRRVRVFGGA